LTAVMFQVEVWVLMMYSVVVGFQRFGGLCCLNLQSGPLKFWYP